MDSVEEFYVRLASKPLPIFCFLVSIVNFLLPRAELPLGVSSLLYTGFPRVCLVPVRSPFHRSLSRPPRLPPQL